MYCYNMSTPSFETTFLLSLIKRFHTYKQLGDKTLERLTNEQLYYTPNNNANSIAIIIQHLHGNMLSRFTNFLTEDGEKPWRQRDAEFETQHFSKEMLLQKWEQGWQCLFGTLQNLQPGDLQKTIYIRHEPLVVADALLRQLAHYPYHVAQIIHIAKTVTTQWQSLSIEKGKSNEYNSEMKNRAGGK
jgi:Protein of unknown function (DUF1572)